MRRHEMTILAAAVAVLVANWLVNLVTDPPPVAPSAPNYITSPCGAEPR